MKASLILVTGWAHPKEALLPFRDALKDHLHVQLVSSRNEVHFIKGMVAPPRFLAGWSMGGMLAMEEVCANPEGVDGLILINTTAKFCNDEDYPHGVPLEQLKSLVLRMSQSPQRALRSFFRDVAMPDRAMEKELDVRVQGAMQLGMAELFNGLQYLNKTDLRPLLERIKLPTQILHAREDLVMFWRSATYLDEHIANSELKLLEDRGHDSLIRYPEEVAGHILDYVERSLDDLE